MTFNLTAALRLNDAGFIRGMNRANRSISGLKSGIGGVVSALGLVTTAAAGIGVAMSSVNKAMDFESQMSTIKALTNASDATMASMQKLALEMGAKTKYSALEAAQGIEELLKAGMEPATVQAGGLEAALTAATAGGMGLADASALMANSMNGFKKDALSAAETANILAGAANASAADMIDLKYGLAAVGPVASGLGMSFKDTNAALALFTNNNMSGADAGTSLKTMLMNLIPSTKKAREEMMDLGMITKDGANQFFDSKGKIKDLAGVTDVLHKALKDLNPEQRSDELKTLFGSDAIRAGTILFEEGAKGVKKMHEEMSKVTALDVAREKMNNATGAVEQFKGAMETLQISVLLPLMPVIKDAANNAAIFVANLKPETIESWGVNIKNAAQGVLDFATFIVQHWVPIRETIIGITVALASFRLGLIALTIISTITTLIRAYRAGTIAATIAQWAANGAILAFPGTWIVAAIAAVIAIGVLLYRNWDTVKAKAMELWAKLGPLQGVILALIGPIRLLIQAGISLKDNWSNVWSSIQQGAASAVNGVISKINALIKTINLIPGVNVPIIPKVSWGNTKSGSYAGGGTQSSSHAIRKSYASGLPNVPYNGYQATLHKGERVLTPEENDAYKKGGKGGVTVNVGTMHVRKDSDIKDIAYQLAKLIEKEGAWA